MLHVLQDAAISLLAASTLFYVIYKVRFAFGKHYMNIFTYLMLVLIIFALISKCHIRHISSTTFSEGKDVSNQIANLVEFLSYSEIFLLYIRLHGVLGT